MSQPESRLSRRIMEAIRGEGHFCFKVHGSEFMTAGLPDIIVCAKGFFIGLEVKMPGQRNNTSARQNFIQGEIRVSGGVSEVVCSINEALEIIQNVISGLPPRKDS